MVTTLIKANRGDMKYEPKIEKEFMCTSIVKELDINILDEKGSSSLTIFIVG